MATIYKRDKRKKNEPYSIQYVDHAGKRRTTQGFTDKGLSEQLAAKLEAEARLRRTGLIDPEQERLVECKHARMTDKGARESNTLLLPTRQHAGPVAATVGGCGHPIGLRAHRAPPQHVDLRHVRGELGAVVVKVERTVKVTRTGKRAIRYSVHKSGDN